MTEMKASEVTDLFRQALQGEIVVRLLGRFSWQELSSGEVEYMFGDWQITFFNDCMDLDYVDSATSLDGRTGEYEDWEPENPVDKLTSIEYRALAAILESIKPEVI
jgi:hypothetical protein